MSLYTSILIEALLSTLWPLNDEVTSEAMRLFGGYDMAQAAAASSVGAVVAALLLWVAGRLFQRQFGNSKAIAQVTQAAGNASFFSQGVGVVAMALVWLPMGFMVALVAGFLRTPFWKMAILSSLGCGFYYTSQLMWL